MQHHHRFKIASVLFYTLRQTKTQLHICQNLKVHNKSTGSMQESVTGFRGLCQTLILDLFATSRFSQRLDLECRLVLVFDTLENPGLKPPFPICSQVPLFQVLGDSDLLKFLVGIILDILIDVLTHRLGHLIILPKAIFKGDEVCVVVPQKHRCNLIVILHPTERFPSQFVPTKLH